MTACRVGESAADPRNCRCSRSTTEVDGLETAGASQNPIWVRPNGFLPRNKERSSSAPECHKAKKLADPEIPAANTARLRSPRRRNAIVRGLVCFCSGVLGSCLRQFFQVQKIIPDLQHVPTSVQQEVPTHSAGTLSTRHLALTKALLRKATGESAAEKSLQRHSRASFCITSHSLERVPCPIQLHNTRNVNSKWPPTTTYMPESVGGSHRLTRELTVTKSLLAGWLDSNRRLTTASKHSHTACHPGEGRKHVASPSSLSHPAAAPAAAPPPSVRQCVCACVHVMHVVYVRVVLSCCRVEGWVLAEPCFFVCVHDHG